MSRREELAQVRERDRERNPRCRWTYVAVDGTPSECGDNLSVHEAKGNTHEFVGPDDWADRRFLLGLVDGLAVALGEALDLAYFEHYDSYTARRHAAIRRVLSDLGPDA